MSADEPERPAFGALLRRLRLNARLSQEALAERARISVQAVSALERGARAAPQRQTLRLLADGLALDAAGRAELESAALQSAKPRVRGGLGPLKRALPRTLPATATSFLGRDREVATIVERLGTNRMVTIWGPGGVGKTRLAVAAAQQARDGFPDGVVFVELAPVVDGVGVPTALAAALGIHEGVNADLVDAAATALTGARVLVVLDNCEHVLEACSVLGERLMAAASGVALLVTSREPLRIAGEQVYELGPLASPHADDDDDALRATAAVQLFIDRAESRGAAYDERSLRAIATICRRLDGIPLAIELAAARLPSMDAGQVAAALDDRFQLLTRGNRTAPSRQLTLAGALDWSYDLLRPEERVVLRRVALLVGNWTLDDACAVAGEAAAEHWSVVDALTGLIDKAMVAVAPTGNGERRYRMLETTREYGLARLRHAGEVGERERFRAEHIRRVADAALAGWWEHRTEPQRLDADNVRAALHWTVIQRNDVALGASIAGTLAFFWDVLGLQVEGLRWIDASIALLDEGDASATLWLGRSLLARRLHLRHDAYTSAQRAIVAADRGAPAFLRGRARLALAYAAAGLELHDESTRRIDEAEGLFREAGDTSGAIAALHARAFAAFRDHRPHDARDALERVVAMYRAQGATRMLVHGMIDLAEAEYGLGNRPAAIVSAREGAAGARALATPQLITVALSNLAAYLLDQDDDDDVEEAAAVGREACAASFEQQFGVLTSIAVQACALAGARRGAALQAAQLAGYVELTLSAAGAPREGTEQRTYDILMRLLREAMSQAELETATDAGMALSEDEAVRLALEITRPMPEPHGTHG